MQDIYLTFEFDKIRDSLAGYAKTSLGRLSSHNLTMFTNNQEMIKAIQELEEMSSLILRYGPLPLSSSENVLHLIEIAKKTALLTPRDLYFIAEDVKTISLINKYLSKVDSSYPLLLSKRDRFFDLTNIEKEIRRNITSSLSVSDNATPELKEIRHSLHKLEEKLNQKVATMSLNYSSYLSDSNVTLREGHFVLPVKTTYKNKVLGIVYDVSDSGNTTFIEPLEIVELNNQITAYKVQEQEEIRKILKALTSLVFLQEREVSSNNIFIGEFDFLSAKALFGQNNNYLIAKQEKEQIIELTDAYHPLIDIKKVVKNSYSLAENKRIIIISGPNAGGKTVSLKTVGMIILMNQCGLPIPSKAARLSYFNHIYLDIGDNQSLSDNLSTFSAHISQIGEITNLVKKNDLVLLDELGTGTDPKEGEALALSVCKHLEKKHCFAMISSHFEKMKEYAFSSPNAENSSMMFDEKELRPTYLFKQGVAGKSYAIDVATRYHLHSEIIQEAQDTLKGQKKEDYASLLESLQKKMEEVTFLETKLEKQKEEINQRENRLRNDEKNLKNQREHLLETVNKQKEEIIAQAKEQIDEIVGHINKDSKLHETIAAKHQLDELKDKEETILYHEEIKVGDYVSIPDLSLAGMVTYKNRKKARIAGGDGLTYEVELNRLHRETIPLDAPITRPKKVYEPNLKTNINLELNIIGFHRQEAYDKLIDYLDSCRLLHFKTVRIIHGFGNGILRNMVHEYLKTQKDCTFRLGDINEGGGGATVVTFK